MSDAWHMNGWVSGEGGVPCGKTIASVYEDSTIPKIDPNEQLTI